MAAVSKVAAEFNDHVVCIVVYIIEAHPSDGWQMKEHNEDFGVCQTQT